jgi:hypothetical protein
MGRYRFLGCRIQKGVYRRLLQSSSSDIWQDRQLDCRLQGIYEGRRRMRISELNRYHVVETPSRLVDIPPETSPAID